MPEVKGITNNIAITSRAATSDVPSRIQEALRRFAQLDARNDDAVTLEAEVHSVQERHEAQHAAWHLEVRP